MAPVHESTNKIRRHSPRHHPLTTLWVIAYEADDTKSIILSSLATTVRVDNQCEYSSSVLSVSTWWRWIQVSLQLSSSHLVLSNSDQKYSNFQPCVYDRESHIVVAIFLHFFRDKSKIYQGTCASELKNALDPKYLRLKFLLGRKCVLGWGRE